ncbi:hypothetical protein [Capnocytophaga felis]|uniref:hypothetical protein n=1 Tax=Capnocytophaga felis TaxID=2267611 RepID=UPI0012D36320|nr:hypothetical protein [Capnocytophaga felis]
MILYSSLVSFSDFINIYQYIALFFPKLFIFNFCITASIHYHLIFTYFIGVLCHYQLISFLFINVLFGYKMIFTFLTRVLCHYQLIFACFISVSIKIELGEARFTTEMPFAESAMSDSPLF